MSAHGHQSPAQIHARLKHPVIDGDGHWVEYEPVFSERMRKVGGDKAADGFLAAMKTTRDALTMSVAERRRRRIAQPGFWTRQTENTLDRATAMMPRMLYERLDEFGTDFAIIYPTAGLRLPRIHDDATRRAVIRAYNIVSAEYFRDLGDRMTPAAIIPMHTPDEAIAELEYATKQLGAKAGMFGSGMARRVASVTPTDPDTARLAVWYDVLGIDSDYNYDPVWAKCEELGIAPTFHSSGNNQGLRLSPTNFVYNHIGHFAAAGHAVAKGIFLGGVTRRFPKLRFAFLEGGVGWGCQFFGDLLEHWERRNRKALEHMDPKKLDRSLLMSLVEKHGYDDMAAVLRQQDGWPDPELAQLTGGLDELDDFAACKITRKEDWRDLFITPFYFGCEADDRTNAWAFSKGNPFGAQINAIYSSDIGHFDVIDMRDPLPEAFELVEHGLLTEDNFRDFTFANSVRLWGTQNPKFFEGTVVAKQAAALLAETAQPSPVQAAAE
ncbi:MAG: amidohydrolase family protein [Acetobacteraceae bacterium]|jgi:predicted TIM-barrel fold metal-dependent hydrolase